MPRLSEFTNQLIPQLLQIRVHADHSSQSLRLSQPTLRVVCVGPLSSTAPLNREHIHPNDFAALQTDSTISWEPNS